MKHCHSVHIFINREKYQLEDSEQTGASLKDLAGISHTDTLFLQRPGEDLVISNDGTIKLKNGSRLHSQPPADYGLTLSDVADAGLGAGQVRLCPQARGWTFLIISDHRLPDGYEPKSVDVLVKLPPLFPDAAPDMYWVRPHVRTLVGQAPRNTTTEQLLGEPWQRFSWHLKPGAWKPGVSSLRDYLRCIRSRFLRFD